MREVRIGLCIDPVGTSGEIEALCNLLKHREIRATVTVPGRVGKMYVSSLDHLRPFLESGHEVVNHTYSHPVRIGYLDEVEREKEILLQHQRLLELGNEFGKSLVLKGFRAPYYAYDEGVFGTLQRLGYRWDSSALYSPLLGVGFKPFIRKGIVEIPVLFPDDMTLIERMLRTPEEILQFLWRSYEGSEKYFVWTVHPYGSAKNEERLKMLEDFLNGLKKDGGKFLTLSEMAEEILKEI